MHRNKQLAKWRKFKKQQNVWEKKKASEVRNYSRMFV